MAHYDCRHCGASMWERPNCCQKEQDSYIEGQKKQWAEDNAKRKLVEKHKKEIKVLAEVLFDNKDYHHDKMFISVYLSEVSGPTKGEKLK